MRRFRYYVPIAGAIVAAAIVASGALDGQAVQAAVHVAPADQSCASVIYDYDLTAAHGMQARFTCVYVGASGDGQCAYGCAYNTPSQWPPWSATYPAP